MFSGPFFYFCLLVSVLSFYVVVKSFRKKKITVSNCLNNPIYVATTDDCFLFRKMNGLRIFNGNFRKDVTHNFGEIQWKFQKRCDT